MSHLVQHNSKRIVGLHVKYKTAKLSEANRRGSLGPKNGQKILRHDVKGMIQKDIWDELDFIKIKKNTKHFALPMFPLLMTGWNEKLQAWRKCWQAPHLTKNLEFIKNLQNSALNNSNNKQVRKLATDANSRLTNEPWMANTCMKRRPHH